MSDVWSEILQQIGLKNCLIALLLLIVLLVFSLLFIQLIDIGNTLQNHIDTTDLVHLKKG